MQAAHLELNQRAEVCKEAGRIIIKPVQQRRFDLDALVAGINDENRHSEIDFGLGR